MEIVKYTKKGNGNYQILFDNGKKININEDKIHYNQGERCPLSLVI